MVKRLAYNSHVHTFVSHTQNVFDKPWIANVKGKPGACIQVEITPEMRETGDRLISGCLFEDMLLESDMALKVRAYARSL